MRKLIYTISLFIGLSTFVSAQETLNVSEEIFGTVSYYTGTYENFIAEGSKQPKPIMLLFCRQGCHTCNHLKRGLGRKDVGEYFNRYFFSMYIDSDKEKFKMFPLSEKYGASATPYFVFLTPDGKIIYKGTLNPNQDSLLEKCSEIVARNNNYSKIALEISASITPEQQAETAKTMIEKFKTKLDRISPEQLLSNIFMTSGNKSYKVFNETFVQLAVTYSNEVAKASKSFKVDEVTTASNVSATCTKRGAKWQKWSANK